jgi:hypothetical protein
METNSLPTDAKKSPRPRWFQPTPGRLLIALLAVEATLLLSERLQWFPFNGHKGWTVLIAIACVGATIAIMLLWFLLALVFRWRFQFSLRSLLILMAAVAVPFSWLAVEMQRARRQNDAVAALQKGGYAGARYDYENFDAETGDFVGSVSGTEWLRNMLGLDFFSNVKEISFASQAPLADEGMKCLRDLPHLQNLGLYRCSVTDAGLENVEGLDDLRWLALGETAITDAGLVHLRGLKRLGLLSLCKTRVTDAGMKHLEELTSLGNLDLRETAVTDAGLKHIERMTLLHNLELRGTKTTSAGLVHLKGLTNLEYVALETSGITDDGLENLQGLTKLHSLSLDHSQITDAGLVHLKKMTQLPALSLKDTKVTDAGLEQLHGMSNLKYINLAGTQVTDGGVERLKRALPQCRIER